MNNIVHQANDANANKHNDRPIERLGSRVFCSWPACPEENEVAVDECYRVDRSTQSTETPTRGWKISAPNCSFVEDAANGDAVGSHKSHELEGNYCVEGDGGADIDECKETRYYTRYNDRVAGNCSMVTL